LFDDLTRIVAPALEQPGALMRFFFGEMANA
jgi:hypothetical protein